MVTNIKSYIRAATQTNLKKNLPEIIVKVKYERKWCGGIIIFLQLIIFKRKDWK